MHFTREDREKIIYILLNHHLLLDGCESSEHSFHKDPRSNAQTVNVSSNAMISSNYLMQII